MRTGYCKRGTFDEAAATRTPGTPTLEPETPDGAQPGQLPEPENRVGQSLRSIKHAGVGRFVQFVRFSCRRERVTGDKTGGARDSPDRRFFNS